MKALKLTLWLLAFCIGTLSAAPKFSFKKYQVEDGLSHNTVWCALQDSCGFMWFGTSDGLNLFDGKRNKVYRNMLNEDFLLENNYIETLLEDGQDIWIGTNTGIYIYQRTTDKFLKFDRKTAYGVLISSEVRKIIKTDDGRIWIATLGQGLFIYDPAKGTLEQSSTMSSFFWDICAGDDGNIYAASLQEGLCCFNRQGKPLQTFRTTDAPGNDKISCVESIHGRIWMGSGTNRLCGLNLADGQMECYDAPFNLGTIRCLLRYSGHELLLGTDNGLYMFDEPTRQFQRMDNPLSASAGLSDPAVNGMMWDAEGTLWVLTNLGGVNYMPKETKRFDSYVPAGKAGTSGAGKVIGPFCENEKGDIWIGTRNGLYYFNTQDETLTEYPIGKRNGTKPDIRSLLLDGDKLWIGTYGEGAYVMNLKSGTVKNYTHSHGVPNSIGSNDVLCIYRDHNGSILTGTSWGLCRYAPESDDFRTVNTIGSMISVTDINEDTRHNLWIATGNNGVFYQDAQNKNWKHFTHQRGDSATIGSNSVICIYKDMEGTMWFGTNGGGLCFFNPANNRFVNIDPQNNLLPNNVVYSIEQDQNGNLWISSNIGLVQFHPSAKSKYKLFTVNDGLQGNQFTVQSSLKASNGKLYFGGINGFNVFAPDLFRDNEYLPPVYITNIDLPNQPDNRNVKKILQLHKPVYMARRVVLPFKYNSLTIGFAALSYEDPKKNRYSYMLKGIDKEWVTETAENSASYNNLPPGEYDFYVKGSNNDGKWNPEAASLHVVVTPPWWRSTVACYLYLLLGLLLAYAVGRQWYRRVKRKYERRMKEYQTEQEKKTYQSKIDFFVNLVHEIRTPLTLIKLPLEKMMEKPRIGNDAKFLHVIGRNVGYLMSIISQLLDFQKMENGALQLQREECSVNDIVQEAYNQFLAPAELKGIELHLSLTKRVLLADVDRRKVYTILVNLMGNALKYARTFIALRLEMQAGTAYIRVENDGMEIPREQQDKIFEPFYQLPEHNQTGNGTGIGLAFAKSLAQAHGGDLRTDGKFKHGAAFVLTLPLTRTEPQPQAAPKAQEADATDKENGETGQESKQTVLLVEDDTELLRITAQSLQSWYRVLAAANGREALRTVANEYVDVIVSDVMMPLMNGIELCGKVKSNLAYSHIPFILLTAKTTLESKTEGLESGADAYIEKPFSIKQLHAQIENLFKLRNDFRRQLADMQEGTRIDSLAASLNGKDREFVEQLQKLIEEQVANENFSIDTFAEKANMSRSNFYRKIKSLTGLSPNEFVKITRLRHAARLLLNGCSVAEAAEQSGFASSSYFAKCFKARYGVLPKDYNGEAPVSHNGNLP